MSNFGENKTFSQIFHEQQTSHYGIQSGAAPHMSSSSQNITESRGQATHSSKHKNGPYPAGSKSSVPSRKPVGGDRTKPSASTTKNQPESSARANRSGAPDLNKALPRIPDNAIPPFIARDATGKFNQRFKTPEGNAPQAPVGFTQRVDLPALAKAQLQSLATPPPTAPKAPRPTTPRPDSSKGLPSMERKRTNSAMSGFFSPSTSRRGSLTEAARNAGKWAKGKADILTMNQAERDSFMKGATRAHEREVEAARRADPSTRPLHQQKMLVEKQKASHPGEAWGAGPAEASFEAQMQERAFRSRTAKEYMKRHEQECAVALLEGRLRPPTPEAGKYSPPAGSLTSEERAEALEFDPESEVMMLTKTEKIALQLSRKLDAFKSSRKDSDCSDMDFGMTDAAPVGAIQFCGEMADTTFYNQGCHMPSRTHLKMGLCEACYAFKKHLGISGQ